jgi:hypothetical protein
MSLGFLKTSGMTPLSLAVLSVAYSHPFPLLLQLLALLAVAYSIHLRLPVLLVCCTQLPHIHTAADNMHGYYTPSWPFFALIYARAFPVSLGTVSDIRHIRHQSYHQHCEAGIKPVKFRATSEQSGCVKCRINLLLNRLLSHLPSPEYVLSTLDKVVNWARQGSMWPMTFGMRSRPWGYTLILSVLQDWLAVPWR